MFMQSHIYHTTNQFSHICPMSMWAVSPRLPCGHPSPAGSPELLPTGLSRARARVTQLRARSSCAPGAAPGSSAQPPLATRRPGRAWSRRAQRSSRCGALRRCRRSRARRWTSGSVREERLAGVVAVCDDGRSMEPPVAVPPRDPAQRDAG